MTTFDLVLFRQYPCRLPRRRLTLVSEPLCRWFNDVFGCISADLIVDAANCLAFLRALSVARKEQESI